MLVESSALHAQSVPEVEGGQAKVRSCAAPASSGQPWVWSGCTLVLLQRNLRVDEQQRKGWTVENDTKRHQHGRPGAHTWKSTVQSILAGP